ncbi:hypothetical protein KIN20_017529 [Parelaphostrongylus tenuis]|uniref:Uncharacterized protein n=1 Tax=Parelaphostrongylus tenuis TaxID=148309 RepID=A0AAD5QRK0_PARTN|nr:hypothetical protein KIN20_017529 [Parelaphostrongylus tenuis]
MAERAAGGVQAAVTGGDAALAGLKLQRESTSESRLLLRVRDAGSRRTGTGITSSNLYLTVTQLTRYYYV